MEDVGNNECREMHGLCGKCPSVVALGDFDEGQQVSIVDVYCQESGSKLRCGSQKVGSFAEHDSHLMKVKSLARTDEYCPKLCQDSLREYYDEKMNS